MTAGKEQSARIRVENIIREDINVELLEILELYCELLLARIGLLDTKECDPGLEEAVKTIIYSAPRIENKELHNIREILIMKFGKEFGKDAIDNVGNIVPEKVIKRLSIVPPSQELVVLYLKEIARAYHAPFSELSDEEEEEEEAEEADSDSDVGGNVGEKVPVPPLNAEPPTTPSQTQRLSGVAFLPNPQPKSPISISGPTPSTDNVRPTIKIPKPKASGDKELDALKKRFEALRK